MVVCWLAYDYCGGSSYPDGLVFCMWDELACQRVEQLVGRRVGYVGKTME